MREPGAPLKSFCSSTNEGDEYGNDFRNLSQGLSQSVLEGLGSLKVNGSSPEDEDMVQSSQEGAWCRSCSCSCPVIVVSVYVLRRAAADGPAPLSPPLAGAQGFCLKSVGWGHDEAGERRARPCERSLAAAVLCGACVLTSDHRSCVCVCLCWGGGGR